MYKNLLQALLPAGLLTFGLYTADGQQALAGGNTLPEPQVFGAKDKTITVRKGKAFVIKLESNATTGYKWNIKPGTDKKVLKFSGSEYVSPENPPGNAPVVGQGGNEYWKFSALKKGKTEIRMFYSRPWETDQPPAEEIVFNVIVNN